MDASITAAELKQSLRTSTPPLVIDVRRNARFLESPYFIKGALRRDPERLEEWKRALPNADIVVYCVHGHEVSQNAAKALGARYLAGGIEHWREEGGETIAKPVGAPTRWVTRERPKIDRIACPWLIRRFIDADAKFLYVPAAQVKETAEAIPFDVPGAEFGHHGERCSFDAFIEQFNLRDAALDRLARIVRAADTHRLDLAPEAAGLLAISTGLGKTIADDHALLEHGMAVYDALYAACR
ncbi:MAG TPA: chromate resistance protein ChrB domain-containing protein [Burkholderiales bacterium]